MDCGQTQQIDSCHSKVAVKRHVICIRVQTTLPIYYTVQTVYSQLHTVGTKPVNSDMAVTNSKARYLLEIDIVMSSLLFMLITYYSVMTDIH